MIFQWPAKRRIPWLLGALALMFGSAYSIFQSYSIRFAMGGVIGLPQYAPRIPVLAAEAMWWGRMGAALPFVAAILLGIGRDGVVARIDRVEPTGQTVVTYSAESRKWLAPIVSYFLRLAVSLLGTLGFMVLILLVLFAIFKLGIHMG
jgi:hypothetical protein